MKVEPSAPSTGSHDDDAERSGGVSKAKSAQLQSEGNFQLSFGSNRTPKSSGGHTIAFTRI